MSTMTLPVIVTVSRTPARRIVDAARGAWQDWRRARDEQRSIDQLAQLDAHTLRDIGASEELRAYAEARQSGAYGRFSGLLG
jgi:uncharacterized protein YjiS (DUF1127 family)